MTAIIEAWKPMVRGSLRGFARVRFPSGLIFEDVSVHRNDGRAWASPAAKPMLDSKTLQVVRDPATDKVKYVQLISFATNEIRRNWSDQILAALDTQHPDWDGGMKAPQKPNNAPRAREDVFGAAW